MRTNMKPTYLYIKEHTKTGLKYFGKTTKKDPIKYKGSGLHWKRHLEKHGNEVKTIWLKLFEDENELIEFAMKFSVENDIVNSSEWANMKNENGLDGGRDSGFTGTTHTEENRKKFSDNMKKNNPMHNEKVRKKHLEKMKSEEVRKKRSTQSKGNQYVKGKSWYNNGKITKMFETPPDSSWIKGRLQPHWNTNRKKEMNK